MLSSLEYGETVEPIDFPHTEFDWFGDRHLPDETYLNTELTQICNDLSWIRLHIQATMSDAKTRSSCLGTLAEFLSQLHALDVRLDEWFAKLPSEWWPTSMFVPLHDEVWNGIAHIYAERVVSGVFSVPYVMRIIIHEAILRLAYHLHQDPPMHSTEAIQNAADGISATIPWLFGSEALGEANPARDYNHVDPGAWLRGSVPSVVRAIPWAANCTSCVPDMQRQWLKGRLESLARDTGSAQARAFAQDINV